MRTNLRELGVEIEATPGSAETIEAGDLLVRTREGDTFTEDAEVFDTEEVQASSSKRPSLIGRTLFDATVSYVLRGPASQSVAPAISDLIRSAMFIETAISKSAIGTVTSGPFQDGEALSFSPSGAAATAFRDTADGAAEIKYHTVTGTPASADTITGATSGATAVTSEGEVANGFRYKPADSNFGGSDTKHHVTTMFLQDGFQIGGRGCLSNLSMEFAVGKPVTVTQRLLGAKQSHGDQALFAPATYPEESNAAPRFLSAALKLGSYTPTDIRSMTLNVETNPEAREDAQDANGVLYADYQKDAPTLTVDPAMVLAATKNFFQELDDGTTFAVEWSVGTTAGLIWTFYADLAQYTSVEFGAERTLATAPLELRLNGTDNDEIIIWQH